MANELTFILRARNEAGRATKQFRDDMRAIGTDTKKVGDEAKRAARETDNLGKQAAEARGSFDLMSRAATGLGSALGQLVAGLSIGAAIGISIQQAREFSTALAEVSTVVEGTPEQLRDLSDAARDLATTYGGTGASQLSGFYQAISAGITDVALATDLVDQANKLAVGGVTDVTTAVDILTTAVNAYTPAVLSATEASDALFIGALGGKTTIEELSASLGDVIPIAKAAGISFDEVVAAVSALTTQGIATPQATTQIKALLTGVIRAGANDTTRFAQAAREMGLEFNIAALQAKGLEGFLADLIAATGGSADEISRLFESIEAVTGVLALTGAGGEQFARILDQMRDKAGVTDEAFQKVAESLNQRLKVALASLLVSAEQIGTALLTVLVPAMEALAGAVALVVENVDVLVIALAALAGPALLGALGGFARVLTLVTSLNFAIGAATVAMQAFNFALRAVGFGAFVFAATQILRLLGDLREVQGEYTTALADTEDALVSLNREQRLYTAGLSENSDALLTAARDAEATLMAAINAAEARRRAAEATRTLTLGLFGGGALADARNDIASLTAELDRVQGTIVGLLPPTTAFADAWDAFFSAPDTNNASELLGLLETQIAEFQARYEELEAYIDANDGLLGRIFGGPEDRQQLADARAELEQVGAALFEYENVLSFVENTLANLTRSTGEAAVSYRDLAQSTRTAGEATFSVVPSISALKEKYGELAFTVRDALELQNELALANEQINFDNALAGVSELADGLSLNSDYLDEVNQKIAQIKALDSFGDQATAALELAQHLNDVLSTAGQLTPEAQAVVEALLEAALNAADVEAASNGAAGAISGAATEASRLAANLQAAVAAIAAVGNAAASLNLQAIGDEAVSRALAAGQSVADARVAGQVAAERARLAPALAPSSDMGTQMAATQALSEYEAAAQRASAASEQVAADIQAALAAGSTSGGGSTSSGGGTTAEDKMTALETTMQRLTDEFRMQAETAGLSGQALEDYRIRQELLQAAQQDGVTLNEEVVASILAQRDAYEQAAQSAETFAAGAAAGFEDFKDSVQTNMEFARSFTQNVFQGMSDTIAEFVKTGKLQWQDLLIDLLSQIAQFLANRLVIDFLGMNGNFTGGTGGLGTMDFLSSLGSAVGGLFGGGRSYGGPVQAGSLYAVNERTPRTEYFMPTMPGQVITPEDVAAAMGGATSPVINMTIVTPDANSFRRSQGQITADMAKALDRASRRNN